MTQFVSTSRCQLLSLVSLSRMASQENYGLSVGSMPKAFSYHGEDEDPILTSDVKPRILLMGLRRSGKSSIQKVNKLFRISYSLLPHCNLHCPSCILITKWGSKLDKTDYFIILCNFIVTLVNYRIIFNYSWVTSMQPIYCKS